MTISGSLTCVLESPQEDKEIMPEYFKIFVKFIDPQFWEAQ